MRLFILLKSPLIIPSLDKIPDKNISPKTSIIPEPQIPVISTFEFSFSRLLLSIQPSIPITQNFGSNVFLSTRTLSIAPGAAL